MTLEEFKRIMNSGERIVACSPVHLKMHEYSESARKITFEMNTVYHTAEELRDLFAQLTQTQIDSGFRLFPPFYTDCGKNIKLGKNVFINSGCCFQDQGGIEIGDGSFIGQQTVIATINHDLKPSKRGDMFPKPVKIGKRVWIGAHVTILPGVTVGDNAVIGAGSVVTKDVAPDTVVAGVPARKIRDIPKEQDE
ncbi:MAG: sugar O-acetyltransferase [Clostridia bacterium]|nr:sugar O-acetyltransferase [Clostridia bacterium]